MSSLGSEQPNKAASHLRNYILHYAAGEPVVESGSKRAPDSLKKEEIVLAFGQVKKKGLSVCKVHL